MAILWAVRGSKGVNTLKTLNLAYVCREFCLSHFLSGGPLIPRGLLKELSIW